MMSWRGLIVVLGLAALAAPVLALPLAEGFEGAFPAAGWQTLATGDGNAIWTGTSLADPVWGLSARSQRDNTILSGNIRQWLITPVLYADSAHDELSFYLKTSSASVSPYDTVWVLLSTQSTAPSDFSTTLATLSPGNDFDTSFVRFSFSLRRYSGAPFYVAFVHAARNSSAGTILLDNVSGPLLILPPAPPSFPTPPDSSTQVSVTSTL